MANLFNVTRLGVSVNLPPGGTHDVLLVSTPDGFPAGQLHFRFEITPRKITGIQKVAQMFLKVWLTSKGSDILRPYFGTDFNSLAMHSNRSVSTTEFTSLVSTTIRDAESQTKNIMNTLSSDNASKLDKIIIQGVDVAAEGMNVYLQMVTMAGELGSISLPFPQLDLKLNTNI